MGHDLRLNGQWHFLFLATFIRCTILKSSEIKTIFPHFCASFFAAHTIWFLIDCEEKKQAHSLHDKHRAEMQAMALFNKWSSFLEPSHGILMAAITITVIKYSKTKKSVNNTLQLKIEILAMWNGNKSLVR